MEYLYTYERIVSTYNNTPRTYGTEDELFMTEVHVLQVIGDNPGLSQKELAEMTYRTRPAMSMLIKNLDEKGLVSRSRDKDDNRKYIVELTEKGKKIYDYHEEFDVDNYKEILSDLEDYVNFTKEDLEKTSELLKYINKISNKRLNGI